MSNPDLNNCQRKLGGSLLPSRTLRTSAVLVGFLSLLLSWSAGVLQSFQGTQESRAEILIDGLDRWTPQVSISDQYQKGAWWWRQGVDGARGGTLLVTGKWGDERPAQPGSFQKEGEMFQMGFSPGVVETYVDSLVPPLRTAPRAQGWHRIHFGIYSRTLPATMQGGFRFGVRLSDEPFPVFIQGRDDVPEGFQEVFWKAADLTDKYIEISQVKAEMQRPGMGLMAGIDYIRLEPMSASEVARALEDDQNPPPVEKRLFGLMDYTDEVHLWGTFETPEDIRAIVYRHKDAGFGRIYWRAYGTASDHSLRVPEAAPKWTEGDEKAYCDYFKVKVGWIPYIKPCKRFDPLQVAAEYGRQIGIEVHGFVRMANYNRPPRANFWHEHPEFYLVRRDGTRMPRVLSYSHPEVRKFYISIMKDIASTGVRGILLDWLRHPPAVGYEQEVCDSFQKKYGLDMRALPENDPRINAHHSEYIKVFLRNLRQQLTPKNVEVSARVRNLNEYGLDAAAWAKEGLVDTLIEGNWGPGSDNSLRDIDNGVLSITPAAGLKAYVIAETGESGWSRPFRGWFSGDSIIKYAKHYRAKGVDRFGLYESTLFTWYTDRRHAIWQANRIMSSKEQ